MDLPSVILEILAAWPDGLSAALWRAHGLGRPSLADLIRDGLASTTVERVLAGGKDVEITRVRITDKGRRSLER